MGNTGPIRLGFIGCGGIAGSHLRSLKTLPEFAVVAACDINRERAEAFAADAGAEGIYTDWHTMLEDAELDAIDICTPHTLHHEPAIAAAQRGLHVLTEKPMATELADCDAMIAAAEANSVVLMVAQVLRFRAPHLAARQLIDNGRIGEVRNIIRRRWSFTKSIASEPWADNPALAGGWVLYGFGTHEADLMLWLTRSEAVSVFAMGRKINPHWNDYDDITIQAELSNGAMALETHSVNSRASAWDCVVMGTEDSLYLSGDNITIGEETLNVPMQEHSGMRDELAEFAAAIAQGREPEASGRDVRKTMVLLEAAKISMREGRIVDASRL